MLLQGQNLSWSFAKFLDGKPSLYLSTSSLPSHDTIKLLESINSDAALSNVVAIIDSENVFRNDLCGSIKIIKLLADGLSDDCDNLTFIVNLNAPKLIKLANKRTDALSALLNKNEIINIPPLRERITDLALFTSRYLAFYAEKEKRPEKKTLSFGAVGFLLTYQWPGNFVELVNTLRNAVITGHPGKVKSADLKRILRRNGSKIDRYLYSPHLPQYLQQKQAGYLSALKDIIGGNAKAALIAIGENPDLIENDMTLNDLDLLYPEILEEEVSQALI